MLFWTCGLLYLFLLNYLYVNKSVAANFVSEWFKKLIEKRKYFSQVSRFILNKRFLSAIHFIVFDFADKKMTSPPTQTTPDFYILILDENDNQIHATSTGRTSRFRHFYTFLINKSAAIVAWVSTAFRNLHNFLSPLHAAISRVYTSAQQLYTEINNTITALHNMITAARRFSAAVGHFYNLINTE